eukprot:5601355-Prymnesium_polylepis.1
MARTLRAALACLRTPCSAPPNHAPLCRDASMDGLVLGPMRRWPGILCLFRRRFLSLRSAPMPRWRRISAFLSNRLGSSYR